MAGLRPRPYNLFLSLAVIAYAGLKPLLADLGYSNFSRPEHLLASNRRSLSMSLFSPKNIHTNSLVQVVHIHSQVDDDPDYPVYAREAISLLRLTKRR